MIRRHPDLWILWIPISLLENVGRRGLSKLGIRTIVIIISSWCPARRFLDFQNFRLDFFLKQKIVHFSKKKKRIVDVEKLYLRFQMELGGLLGH